MACPAIETHGLTRRYGARPAVDSISMTVPRGSVYGFLGRNGAGKTTTLKLLLGLLRADAGCIRVDGIDVAARRIEAARRVGALLEAQGFYGRLSGQENLDLSRRLLGCPATEVARVLDVVEMRAHACRRVADYSLGMRQRLGLARAMLGAPPVLVLDEPTNGLDPEGIAGMRRLLRELPDRAGATVLVSSHLLGEIEQTATHIGILAEGKLAVEGELARLIDGQAPEIAVETGDMPATAAIARAHGFAVEPAGASMTARLRANEDVRAAVAALAHALCAAGIAVFSIAPRPRSLENLYHSIAAPALH